MVRIKMPLTESGFYREHLRFFPLQVKEEWEEFCGWLEAFPIANMIEIGTEQKNRLLISRIVTEPPGDDGRRPETVREISALEYFA